jgi:hypothetical protein
MPWTPKPSFSGVMEDIVVPNVKTIIEDNFAAALDYYYPTTTLPDFAEITLGQIRRKEFPLLALGPVGNPATESEDSSRFSNSVTIAMYLGVVADDADTVTELIMKYVKVLHAVLISATKLDYFGDSNGEVFGFSLDAEHIYGAIRSNNTILFRDATMMLTIRFQSRPQ